MLIEPSPLEDWLRDYYFTARIDISSSGVDPYTLGEVQELLGLDPAELAAVSFRDSRSAGSDELRALVARRTGITDAARILVTNGSTEAQLLVLGSLLQAGDEVVVAEPAYHSLISPIRALGSRVERWRLRPEQGFQPDLNELRRLVTARTKMIVVNFPHNPTGVTLTAAEQRELVGIAERQGSYLLWDGAFEDITYDAPPLPAASTIYERGLSFGTLSKAFGLPGLRVGWGIVPPHVVRDAISLRDYTTLALSPIVELIACRVLAQPDRLLHERLQTAAKNRDIVRDWFESHSDVVRGGAPASGVLAFPGLPGVSDTVEFCHRMMDRHGVLLVPGECFELPGYVRLGFGGATANLEQGLTALSTELHRCAERPRR